MAADHCGQHPPTCHIDRFDREKAMQVFTALLISGLAVTAITAGTTVYSLRPPTTSAASLTTTSINTPAYPFVTDQNAYRAEQCGGDYVCDEKGAWLSISAAK
jgi:hypothetical protein